MDTNKSLLKHNAKKYAEKRNVDPALIDWDSLLDTSLSDRENWRIIKQKVREEMDEGEIVEPEPLRYLKKSRKAMINTTRRSGRRIKNEPVKRN